MLSVIDSLIHVRYYLGLTGVCCIVGLVSQSVDIREFAYRNGVTNDRGQAECQKKGSRPQRLPVVGSLVPDLGYVMLRLFQPPTILRPVSGHVQALSTPILVQLALSPFHDASSSTDVLIQSPLYVLNGIWSTTPSSEDAIGGVSAIIWSLTLLPLLKSVSVPPAKVLHF